jgi:hypothetical protein
MSALEVTSISRKLLDQSWNDHGLSLRSTNRHEVVMEYITLTGRQLPPHVFFFDDLSRGCSWLRDARRAVPKTNISNHSSNKHNQQLTYQ